MLTEKTEIIMVDDLTGKEIKEDGWVFMRCVDGSHVHTQNIVDMIALLIEGGGNGNKALPFERSYIVKELAQRGIHVLSEEQNSPEGPCLEPCSPSCDCR